MTQDENIAITSFSGIPRVPSRRGLGVSVVHSVDAPTSLSSLPASTTRASARSSYKQNSNDNDDHSSLPLPPIRKKKKKSFTKPEIISTYCNLDILHS